MALLSTLGEPPLEESPREACGVVGVVAQGGSVDVARACYFALYSLQHRGQESAGIAAGDGRSASLHRGMGRVAQVFTEETLAGLKGHMAVGHNRYSTTGGSQLRNAQPFLLDTLDGPLAVAHNGNLVNADRLRDRLLRRGVGLSSTSDTEVIAQMLAAPSTERRGPDWEGRLRALMDVAEGAYCLVVMTREGLYAARDPLGFRPLCYGRLRDTDGRPAGWMVASESCALATAGAEFEGEVAPGEILRLDARGCTLLPPAASREPALCTFEYIYFARPDNIFGGRSVHAARMRLGRALARECPVDADVVFAVPDSATPAAMGFAQESGIELTEGLIKNRYSGRTFIEPSPRLRNDAVRLKYTCLPVNVSGKRVCVIDDSIVRGTTMAALIRLIREVGGAREVHIRVASAPIAHPCFMGVDLSTHGELIAHRLSTGEIRAEVGADSLEYLSREGMIAAVGGPRLCTGCFSGDYPLDVSVAPGVKLRFEGRTPGEGA